MSPFPPSLLADQVPRPGVPMCTRLINGLITSRELVLTWMEWFFNPDGTLSQAFLDMYCYIDCICNPTSLSSLTPDVKSTTPVYFNSDAYFPAGTYQVGYVSGGMHYSVANHNWYVQNPFNPANGWFVKYNAGVDQVKGPGVTTGYATLPLCQAGNIGSVVEFIHTGGTIGLVLVDSPSSDNSGAITFSLLKCSQSCQNVCEDNFESGGSIGDNYESPYSCININNSAVQVCSGFEGGKAIRNTATGSGVAYGAQISVLNILSETLILEFDFYYPETGPLGTDQAFFLMDGDSHTIKIWIDSIVGKTVQILVDDDVKETLTLADAWQAGTWYHIKVSVLRSASGYVLLEIGDESVQWNGDTNAITTPYNVTGDSGANNVASNTAPYLSRMDNFKVSHDC